MARFIPLRFRHLSEAEQLTASQEFAVRMAERRSVRRFSDRPVPIEVIRNAVQAAASSPSGANQQPWRFVVVSDPELKRRIREAAEAEERQNYESRFPGEWLQALEPFATDWHKEFLEVAPYLVAVFRIDYGFDGDRKVKHYYVGESVGIATGILITALHLSGLATLVHTPSPMGFLSNILERPVNERPFLLIPTGYPAEGVEVPDIERKALDEVLVLR
jgi:nitroreductase